MDRGITSLLSIVLVLAVSSAQAKFSFYAGNSGDSLLGHIDKPTRIQSAKDFEKLDLNHFYLVDQMLAAPGSKEKPLTREKLTNCIRETFNDDFKRQNKPTFSVEAATVLCANYEHSNDYSKRFSGTYMNTGDFLRVYKATRAQETSLALQSSPLRATVSELDSKYCNAISGMKSPACAKITACGTPQFSNCEEDDDSDSMLPSGADCPLINGKAQLGAEGIQNIISLTENGSVSEIETKLGHALAPRLRQAFIQAASATNPGSPGAIQLPAGEMCTTCPVGFQALHEVCYDKNGCRFGVELFDTNKQRCIPPVCRTKEAEKSPQCEKTCEDNCTQAVAEMQVYFNADTNSLNLDNIKAYFPVNVFTALTASGQDKNFLNEIQTVAGNIALEAKNAGQTCQSGRTCRRLFQELPDIAAKYSKFICSSDQVFLNSGCVSKKCEICARAVDEATKMFTLDQTVFSVPGCTNTDIQTAQGLLRDQAFLEVQQRLTECATAGSSVCKAYVAPTNYDVEQVLNYAGLHCATGGGSTSKSLLVPAKKNKSAH